MTSQISAVVTYNARCVRSLLTALRSSASINHRRHKPPFLNPILLFALAPSSTTPPEVLSEITSFLTQLYPKHVGCISAPLPYQYFDLRIPAGPHSCSLACALVNGVTFRSTISGRAEAQVGRWHAARQRRTTNANGATPVNTGDSQMRTINGLSESFESDGKVNWEEVWHSTANLVTCPSNNEPDSEVFELPDALRNLDPSAVHNILYFSDKAPEGLGSVLDSAFPKANKLSLIASSTPFVTGRPVTLFHNGSILSDGAAGIVFNSASPDPVVELSFPPLVALSALLNVTSSEGNLILSLDSGNPTQLLLKAIQKRGLASSHATWVDKGDEFYVGVIEPSSQQLTQLHRVNAGDPSRGTIALDAALAPKRGSSVRLYHLLRDPISDVPRQFAGTIHPNSISLFVTPEMTWTAGNEVADHVATDSDYVVLSDAFLAASENGFTLSRVAQGPWKCVVPGGRTGLSWK